MPINFVLSDAEQEIAELIRQSPLMFKDGAAVLHYIFLVGGNGYHWNEDGCPRDTYGRTEREVDSREDDELSPFELIHRRRMRFIEDNADLLAYEQHDRHSLLSMLDHLAVGYTLIERAPADIRNDWFNLMIKVVDDIKSFANNDNYQTMHPNEWKTANSFMTNLKNTEIWPRIESYYERRANFASILEKAFANAKEAAENE